MTGGHTRSHDIFVAMTSMEDMENESMMTSDGVTDAGDVTWSNWTLNLTSLYGDDVNMTSNMTLVTCDDWLEAQHVLFQLANMCFCVSFLTPNSFRFHLLFIRGVLTLGCLFMVIWGASVVCMVDILTWYLAFLLINLSHLCFLTCKLYPTRLHPCLEDLYIRTFKPFKVSRYQFKELTNLAQLKELPAGAPYALETQTRAGQRISVLLSGRLKVSHEKLLLHYIEASHFIDSPEFEAVPRQDHDNDTFQVSISALEDSRLLSWPIHKLHHYLNSRPVLQSVFNTIVGKDITHKLYQVQELLVSRPGQVKVLTSQNSLLNVRQRLSQSTSSHSLRLELNSISGHPSPAHSYRPLPSPSPSRHILASPSPSRHILASPSPSRHNLASPSPSRHNLASPSPSRHNLASPLPSHHQRASPSPSRHILPSPSPSHGRLSRSPSHHLPSPMPSCRPMPSPLPSRHSGASPMSSSHGYSPMPSRHGPGPMPSPMPSRHGPGPMPSPMPSRHGLSPKPSPCPSPSRHGKPSPSPCHQGLVNGKAKEQYLLPIGNPQNGAPRTPSPVGRNSPSEVSFETCV